MFFGNKAIYGFPCSFDKNTNNLNCFRWSVIGTPPKVDPLAFVGSAPPLLHVTIDEFFLSTVEKLLLTLLSEQNEWNGQTHVSHVHAFWSFRAKWFVRFIVEIIFRFRNYKCSFISFFWSRFFQRAKSEECSPLFLKSKIHIAALCIIYRN